MSPSVSTIVLSFIMQAFHELYHLPLHGCVVRKGCKETASSPYNIAYSCHASRVVFSLVPRPRYDRRHLTLIESSFVIDIQLQEDRTNICRYVLQQMTGEQTKLE